MVPVDRLQRDSERLIADLSVMLRRLKDATYLIPSDLLFHAVDVLMPAERMGVVAGRNISDHFVLGALYDVTGRAHCAHVRAEPQKLGRALVAFEQSGARLAAWVHSHPGAGPAATSPSSIDRAQYADWARDFGPTVVGIIVVADGHVRLWGEAVEAGLVRTEIVGTGIQNISGGRYVYKLDR